MLNDINTKRTYGQFYTQGNPFTSRPFVKWAKDTDIYTKTILEPFAGANNIIHTLQAMDMCNEFQAYDINPNHEEVKKLDTIENFPKGLDVVITNPPWLSKNSATRRKLNFPNNKYDDVYKLCIELCLDNCEYVAAILPASFLNSGLFHDRMTTYILLHETMFGDTEHPTCLALFTGASNKKVDIYHDNKYIGVLDTLNKEKPYSENNNKIKFNDPNGQLGFISFDNTKSPSIKFCNVKDIAGYEIKISSRFITRIGVEIKVTQSLIDQLNKEVNNFRTKTNDVFLTPFKGIRDDGEYRRRMDFTLARKFINASC